MFGEQNWSRRERSKGERVEQIEKIQVKVRGRKIGGRKEDGGRGNISI